MRSAQRDQSRTLTFAGTFDGINLASGAGLAAPGVPFTWRRSSLGNYEVRFSLGLVPISYSGTVGGGFFYAAVGAPGGGYISFAVLDANGYSQNGIIYFTCTARDLR